MSAKRPLIVTACCVLMFLGLLVTLPALLLPSARQTLGRLYGSTFVPVTALVLAFGSAGMIGYWRMRKWGVYVYIAMTIVALGYGLELGIPGTAGYLGPLVVAGVGLVNLRKMS